MHSHKTITKPGLTSIAHGLGTTEMSNFILGENLRISCPSITHQMLHHDLLFAPLLLLPEHPGLVIRVGFPGCIPPLPFPRLLFPLTTILTSLPLFWKITLCWLHHLAIQGGLEKKQGAYLNPSTLSAPSISDTHEMILMKSKELNTVTLCYTRQSTLGSDLWD